jgi:hypothetical protein
MSVVTGVKHLSHEASLCPRATAGAKMKQIFVITKKLTFALTLASALTGNVLSQTIEQSSMHDRHALANLAGTYASTVLEPW